MKKVVFLCAVIMLLSCIDPAKADTWTTFDIPHSYTDIYDIDGSNLVGYYNDGGSNRGFLYNITSNTWTTISKPGAVTTIATGIDGSNIVGYYQDASSNNYHGFLYNGITWTTLDMPGAITCGIEAINGGNFAGSYTTNSGSTGYFLYNGATWTSINYPLGTPPVGYELGAWITDISGNDVLGTYEVWRFQPPDFYGSGMIYDTVNQVWSFLDKPGANVTGLVGAVGSTLVGYYYDDHFGHSHGFLYNGTSWTTLDMPGALQTVPIAVDGISIVGSYIDASGGYHHFTYEIPEPTTLLLLGFGGMFLRKRS